MSRLARELASAIMLTAATACAAATNPAGEEATRPPNVVLVLVDDLGWADLGCYGSAFYETPHLDRLAADGMRFTNAYAACAVCSPTRAAVMTGRYPARVGITDWIRPVSGTKWTEEKIRSQPAYVGGNERRLLTPRNPRWMEQDEVTIAELLRHRGYATGFVGKWHLGPEGFFPEDQGFDFNVGGCDLGHPPHYFDPYPPEHQRTTFPNLPPRKAGEYLTDREADEAAGFIARNAGRRFFLCWAPYAVHTPLQAKEGAIEKYRGKEKTHQSNATYAAMIESVDDGVGRILAVLEELDLADETLVIFTSDNGGLLGATSNLPLRDGKGSPFEGGIRVPLVVRWPGAVKPGASSDVPVSSIDFLPTICEAAGAELPGDRAVDGCSLAGLLRGQGAPKRDVLLWHFPHYRYKQVGPYSIIRAGTWKYIRYYDTDSCVLFNLADDPGEERNLAAERPEKAQECEAMLQRELERIGAKVPRPNPDYQPAEEEAGA